MGQTTKITRDAQGRVGAHPPAQRFLVAITGGSGSGKTTLAQAIRDRLGADRVARLSQDAYYRDRGALPPWERARLNYDVPEAFDRALFLRHLRALRSGLPIAAPVYSFESHTRAAETRPVPALPIVLVDGLLLLHDPRLRGLFDLALFLDAPAGLRLERRIRRDVLERGRTAGSVVEQFRGTVLPAHVEYVEPAKAFADLVLDTAGPLEECVDAATNAIAARLTGRSRGAYAPR